MRVSMHDQLEWRAHTRNSRAPHKVSLRWGTAIPSAHVVRSDQLETFREPRDPLVGGPLDVAGHAAPDVLVPPNLDILILEIWQNFLAIQSVIVFLSPFMNG